MTSLQSNYFSIAFTDDSVNLSIRMYVWYWLRSKHLSSSSVFSGVRVDQYLVFCVVFCKTLLSLWTFYFGTSSLYGIWLPFWYLKIVFSELTAKYNCKIIEIYVRQLFTWKNVLKTGSQKYAFLCCHSLLW